MPIIIDINCLSDVFQKGSENHDEFAPVLDWITKGNGKIVYGGSQYRTELRKAHKYLKIFGYFSESGKLIKGNDDNIDKYQQSIESIIPDDDFDDKHLPAIVIETRCRIICSNDTRSISYIKRSVLYPKGIKVPVFYTSKNNINLLSDKYIDKCYKPVERATKKSSEKLLTRIGKSVK